MRSFEELMQDRAFLEGMEGKTKEEAVAMFAAEGYKVTAEQLQELFDLLAEGEPAQEGELSEENLEAVAGGVSMIKTPFGPYRPSDPYAGGWLYKKMVEWLRKKGIIK